MPTPITIPSDLTYVGAAPEAIQGTAVLPTNTILINKTPTVKDNQVYLEDTGLRQSMSEVYGAVLGPLNGEVSLEGDLRSDTSGFLFANILGDYTMTGVTQAPTTTLSSTASAGATQLSCAASIPVSTQIQIGTGLTAECFITGTPSGAGPFTIPLSPTSGAQRNGTLAFTHTSGQTVTAITTPYTYQFAEQCAGTTGANALLAQAHSLSITDWTGLTSSVGARTYPGSMVADLSITLDPQKLLTFSTKMSTWGSAPSASTPSVVVSSNPVLAAWNCLVGIGGPASGGTLVGNVESMSLQLTRQLKIYQALGTAQPYIIRQGKFGVTGKMTIMASSEGPLTDYLQNNQRQLQLKLNSGSGATTQNIQFDMQQVFYKQVVPTRSDEMVKLDVDFTAIANTTNVGASGGFSPIMVTLGNAVGVGTY